VAVVGLHPCDPFGELDGIGLSSLAAACLGAALYYTAIWRERWDLCRWPLTVALGGCLSCLLISGSQLTQATTPLPHRELLMAATLLSSALLLGWSLVAMLLGHWYLIAPGLSFRHLVVFCWVLLVTVLLRLGVVGSTLLVAAGVDELLDPHPLRMLVGFQGQGMFFWVRLLWGIVIPLLLAVLSLRCAQQRSNQSATGILYVLVVGTFIGEITAYYLTLTTGVPA
jgi:hypothetical protein